MPLPHDPEYTSRVYDVYGEREWDRHDASWAARASFEIHRRFLEEFVRPGDYVLDAGSGPGRFTIELAAIGARVHVGDISPRQLELNAERVAAAGCEGAVVGRTRLDICDLSDFASSSFDAVVCFGGPLSYVMDHADGALGELCRVTRAGGHVMVSVMSSVGTVRRFLPVVVEEGREFGAARNDEILDTGDLPRDTNNGHECHMYRWTELSTLLERHGVIVGASAANFLTAQHEDVLDAVSAAEREQVLRWEYELCREPGALDGGTHIVAVVEVPSPPV